MNILVVQGPNLNLLGEREPAIYGHTTLESLHRTLTQLAEDGGHVLRTFQSNSEGDLVDRLHAERHWADVVLINPGALTHTSYVLRDAIEATRVPTWEVHLSDLRKREPWRRKSFVRDVCAGHVSGHGAKSYEIALAEAVAHVKPKPPRRG